jgi:hypothetical protein
MLTQFVKLPRMQNDPWIRLKCFYEQDGKYGEFFVNINPFKNLVLIQAKDPDYQAVLTAAFAEAMQDF